MIALVALMTLCEQYSLWVGQVYKVQAGRWKSTTNAFTSSSWTSWQWWNVVLTFSSRPLKCQIAAATRTLLNLNSHYGMAFSVSDKEYIERDSIDSSPVKGQQRASRPSLNTKSLAPQIIQESTYALRWAGHGHLWFRGTELVTL